MTIGQVVIQLRILSEKMVYKSKIFVADYVILVYNIFTGQAFALPRILWAKELIIMNLVISGKNLDITEGLRSAIEEKIGKLERYFTDSTEVHVTLSTEKNRQKIEITIPMKGSIIRAEEVSSDMYVSIDLVEEVIERQLRKYKNKLIDKAQNAAHLNQEFIDEEVYEDEEIEIIRSKKFAMKPMDPEEACVQMELLGHNFFVFRNSETEEVNVVYKRKGNTYGLIEPEF